MTKPQATSKVQKELRAGGFQPGHRVGSHTKWVHPSGVSVAVPDGHRKITAGVYRTIQKAIRQTKETS